MKRDLIKNCLELSVLFIILAILLFNQMSFWFLGIGIVVIGLIVLYLLNSKK